MLIRYFREMNTTVAINIQDNYLTYGIAVCSQSDQFSKRIGKALATHRCLTAPVTLQQAEITDIMVIAIKSSHQPFAFKLDPFQRIIKYLTLHDYSPEVLFSAASYDYARNLLK